MQALGGMPPLILSPLLRAWVRPRPSGTGVGIFRGGLGGVLKLPLSRQSFELVGLVLVAPQGGQSGLDLFDVFGGPSDYSFGHTKVGF